MPCFWVKRELNLSTWLTHTCFLVKLSRIKDSTHWWTQIVLHATQWWHYKVGEGNFQLIPLISLWTKHSALPIPKSDIKFHFLALLRYLHRIHFGIRDKEHSNYHKFPKKLQSFHSYCKKTYLTHSNFHLLYLTLEFFPWSWLVGLYGCLFWEF